MRQRQADTERAPVRGAGHPDRAALDLVHLARQCQGDAALQRDLLRLFRLQARSLMMKLLGPHHEWRESVADIAHILRGSALTIGAPRVARSAAALEAAALAGDEDAVSQAIAALRASIEDAIAESGRFS